MTRPWEVLKSDLLIERRWLRVHQQRVRTGTGAVIDEFHMIESPAWVGVIALTPERQLVLVRQYRHGHGSPSLELPAGVIDRDETPAQAAARELLEETGYQGPTIEPFWRVRPEPARHRQWAHFTVARDVACRESQSLDETEDVDVVLAPLDQLDEVLADMVHGLHVGALLLALRRGLLD